ncbi:hypothetical protein [Providencia sp. PROV174]|uniref:hypothetical protein n=1 Tax=Providencia sp. PROV174 TaxID=2949877 RepID=UPI00234A41CF|nr:hypothetical protein [Providencia sp. PROV174]
MRVQYFHVSLTQCDYQNVSPMGMVRLIASEKVFFFNQDDFSNSQIFLERIQQGDSLVICAEEMNDGSYWVEWVYHAEHGRLEPDRTVGFNRSLGKQYLISLVLMALIPAVYYCFTEADDSFLMIILVAILGCAAFAGIILFGLALVQTKHILSPKRKLILKALDSVIAGKYKLFEESSYIEIDGIKNPKSKPVKLHKAAEINVDKTSLSVTKGKVNITANYNLTIAAGDTIQTLNKVNLQINKKHMGVLVSANEPLFNNHKLFIAQADELEVLHKNIQEDSKEQVVFGILNHQDGLAYSLIGKGAPQERGFYIGLWGFIFCILALFILAVGSVSISETFEKGGYWDYWDWMNIIDTGVMFISFSGAILLGISFLIALCVAIYFKVSKRGNAYYQSQYFLKQLRRQHGKTDYVTEVRS